MNYDSYIGTTSPGTIQFENANEGRSYPFEEDSVLQAGDGRLLPNSVVSDMHLVVPRGHDACLSSVYLSKYMVSLCVKVLGERPAALSVTVKSSDFRPYVPYRLEKLAGSEDVGGIVTFGNIRFDEFPEPPEGLRAYRYADREVMVADEAVSRYAPAKLRSIVDDRSGRAVSGDVKVDFPSYVEASRDGQDVTLRLAAGANDLLLPECERSRPVNSCGATPVSSINGVSPDSRKRIVIWFH